MFRNLVESGSHARDYKRRGTFFAGAVAFYALALAVAGVGSIYAYNVRLDEREELEVLALMTLPPTSAAPEPQRQRAEERPAAGGSKMQVAKVTEVVKITPYVKEVAKTNAPVLGRHVPFVIGSANEVPAGIGGVGPINPHAVGTPAGTRTGPPVIDGGDIGEPPAKAPERVEPPPRQEPPPQVVRVPSSVLVGKVVSKPVPAYPVIAKQVGAHGTVPVQILVDEQGLVVSAQATGGHPLLQRAAVEAARRARFTPTILTGRPVKVSGVILYNFVLQ